MGDRGDCVYPMLAASWPGDESCKWMMVVWCRRKGASNDGGTISLAMLTGTSWRLCKPLLDDDLVQGI